MRPQQELRWNLQPLTSQRSVRGVAEEAAGAAWVVAVAAAVAAASLAAVVTAVIAVLPRRQDGWDGKPLQPVGREVVPGTLVRGMAVVSGMLLPAAGMPTAAVATAALGMLAVLVPRELADVQVAGDGANPACRGMHVGGGHTRGTILVRLAGS